jgi:hypothetical protein
MPDQPSGEETAMGASNGHSDTGSQNSFGFEDACMAVGDIYDSRIADETVEEFFSETDTAAIVGDYEIVACGKITSDFGSKGGQGQGMRSSVEISDQRFRRVLFTGS